MVFFISSQRLKFKKGGLSPEKHPYQQTNVNWTERGFCRE
jgi:hypothetical protein